MKDQRDQANVKTLNATSGESETFFGCWLDFNQPAARFPWKPLDDGPYPEADAQSIQTLIRGRHQCLVAQLSYTQDPIQLGDTPGSSDNLAQRNLTIVESDNPGTADSHTVVHTFEIRATGQLEPPVPNVNIASAEESPNRDLIADISSRAREYLLVHWRNLPPETDVTIYVPDVDADEVLGLARQEGGLERLERVDEHTVRLRVGGITFLPLPNRRTNIPALITLTLPDSVRVGQRFRVLVQQVRADRSISGTFEISIPVERGSELLLGEERTLAVLRYIQQSISGEDSWARVLGRNVELSAARVEGFGGDPDDILPSPNGAPRDTFAYDFSGFFPPVDNLPALNVENAGRTIPVKFSLSGDQGLDIFAEGYPKSQVIPCDSTALTNGTESTRPPGRSGLSYDSKEGQYTYGWKTERGWAGSCRQLVVKLKDGSFHRANFRFR
jgi:hypothetical protein